MSENETTEIDGFEGVQTSEPVKVQWEGGLGDTQTVEVNPYTGEITVNGRPFDIGTLCSDDVPDWMYKHYPSVTDTDN